MYIKPYVLVLILLPIYHALMKAATEAYMTQNYVFAIIFGVIGLAVIIGILSQVKE